ncbi:hypothetical protein METBIDRAFT_13899 [Metschnikowia bicuspidata var. bicuspidata NRRL YB-4993]|uniref:Hyphally-regulated cell wall protein N-terminal domain-containing protein n=1 Tax=Metschnikowia bicuspidata var. bicuspidata NRRL YB-4993 TaxID=869754 RepID=A0A1A0H1Z9_9ASCO|nr:hypothetical protein METBIDRAFT_13899 [Metschnikowia bicuspidata var. bicuspidata NRRL YB-4993]OBA17983.1 hypothetical protein METBIDRAFT_13899 [Metschnikowia bicuspidata var. bicuspidata NRRL YB-4993]
MAIMDDSGYIFEDKLETSSYLGFSEFMVAENVHFVALNSNGDHFNGVFDNRGEFYVKNTGKSRVNVEMTGNEFLNVGVFVLNSLEAEAVPQFRVKAKASFRNFGDMYVGVSGLKPWVSIIELSSESEWYNAGMIVIRRESDSRAPLRMDAQKLVRKPFTLAPDDEVVEMPPMVNSGSICLQNAHWENTAILFGEGCIMVGSGSFFSLVLRDSADIGFHQKIIMESDSKLEVSQFQSYENEPVILVSGFGRNNEIHIDKNTDGLAYCESSGRLVLGKSNELVIAFDIGRGYDLSSFNLASQTRKSILTYSGTVPSDSRQITCKCVSKFPDTPTVF